MVNGVHVTLQETGVHIGTFAKMFGGGTYSEMMWAVAIVIVLQVVLTFTRWGLLHGRRRVEQARRLRGGRAREARDDPQLHALRARRLVSSGSSRRCAPRTSSRTPRGAERNPASSAIAAAVIGGTLLAGGSGTVVGALIGAMFLGILKDGLILQGVSANYLLFYTGLAIIAAMSINVYVRRLRRGHPAWLTRRRRRPSWARRQPPDDVLRVEHISKRFGPVTALRDVNLHLRKGEVLGLLGDNGAGKSTLIKIISGFQKQDGGQDVPARAAV